MNENSKKHNTTNDANNVLAAGICRHTKHQIAEREFYINQKTPYSGTRIICKKCGANKFIKDAKYGVYACQRFAALR